MGVADEPVGEGEGEVGAAVGVEPAVGVVMGVRPAEAAGVVETVAVLFAATVETTVPFVFVLVDAPVSVETAWSAGTGAGVIG